MSDIAKKLRDMHALAGSQCDPEFSRALLEAAAEIDRLRGNAQGDALQDLTDALADGPQPNGVDGQSQPK